MGYNHRSRYRTFVYCLHCVICQAFWSLDYSVPKLAVQVTVNFMLIEALLLKQWIKVNGLRYSWYSPLRIKPVYRNWIDTTLSGRRCFRKTQYHCSYCFVYFSCESSHVFYLSFLNLIFVAFRFLLIFKSVMVVGDSVLMN